MFPPLIQTEDGSWTLWHGPTQQYYHNLAGAYTESWHHYVEPSGILERCGDAVDVTVVDSCFGLGYNTWSLLKGVVEHPRQPLGTVRVVGFETDATLAYLWPFILDDERYGCLGSTSTNLEHNLYYRTLGGFIEWWSFPRLGLAFHLKINFQDVRRGMTQLAGDVDYVFHDPFSPNRVPQLWTVDLFRQYQRVLKARQGRVLTYSVATAVLAGLNEVGLEVYRTRPLGAKNGGTVAVSPGGLTFWEREAVERLRAQNLSEEEMLERPDLPMMMPMPQEQATDLRGRRGVPYRDPGLDNDAETIRTWRHHEQNERFPLKS